MREGGGCANTQAFYLDDIERRVLTGLEAQLKDPKAIERFPLELHEERKRLAATEEAKRHRKETRLGEVRQSSHLLMDIDPGSEMQTMPRRAARHITSPQRFRASAGSAPSQIPGKLKTTRIGESV
jgi:hypothetical protein